ncbi:unnamed protein product [Musa acuminata subsp. burmannicoides]
MQDLFPVPSCFSSGEKLSQDALPAATAAAATRSRQSMVVSVYRSRVAGHCRLVTVTWCKNLLAHGLSVSVDGPDTDSSSSSSSSSQRNSSDAANKQQHSCKVQISPWQPWRKQGSNRFQIGGETVEVFWDLHSAKFCNEPEPQSDYYVAVVSEGEVVLLLGDLRKEAYRRTSSRPSLIEAVLVARKEHVFGKKRFATRSRFHDKGSRHEISVECSNGGGGGNMDLDMEIKIDGNVVIHVKHLQWKFRGNDSISIDKRRVEVYWDVHGWLFASGLRHALFIFKPESLSSAGGGGGDSCCLFLHAWKLD